MGHYRHGNLLEFIGVLWPMKTPAWGLTHGKRHATAYVSVNAQASRSRSTRSFVSCSKLIGKPRCRTVP